MAGQFNETQAAALLTTWINPKFVAALERDLTAVKFTTKAIIPPGMGRVGRLVSFTSAPGTSAALADGTSTGNLVDITTNTTNISIAEYGEFMQVFRVVDYAQASGAREEILKRFAHGGRIKLDSLVLAEFGKNVTNILGTLQTVNGAGALGTPTAPTGAAAIITARKKVRDNYAQPFYGVPGHTDGHYACIIGEQASLDIVTEFTTGRMTWGQAVTNVAGKIGQERYVNGYIGSIYGTAVHVSQQLVGGPSFSGVNVTNAFVIGDGAVGALAFEDMEPQVFVNTPTSASTNNPYRNFSTVAWHAYFATAVNDASRACKLYTVS
jgi:hypothetical protein